VAAVNAPIFERRRAERLAELLDVAAGRRRSHHRRTDLDAELGELVELTGRVAAMRTAPEPSTEFRTGLRTVLMARIEREGIGVVAAQKAADVASRAAMTGKTQVVRQVSGGHGRTRAAVLIGVTAGALALSGVSAASTDSLPGTALYQVKRSSERAQLALAGSDITRGHLHLEFARSRLSEARHAPPELVAAVLADMDNEAGRGAELIHGWAEAHRDLRVLDALDDFTADQLRGLAALPLHQRDAISRSQQTLAEISRQTGELRESLQR
jgi:hypothetical protein